MVNTSHFLNTSLCLAEFPSPNYSTIGSLSSIQKVFIPVCSLPGPKPDPARRGGRLRNGGRDACAQRPRRAALGEK